MNCWLIAATLILASVSVKAESASTATYLNVSFKSVNVVGASERLIHFKDVSIGRTFINVSADIDSIETVLVRDSEPDAVTTLDVIGATSAGTYDWLKAEKVIISVRSEKDLLLWNKFLQKVREKREHWRKRLHQPSRVLPPKDLSP